MTSGLSHQLIVEAKEAAVDEGLQRVILIDQQRDLRIRPTLTGCGHRSSHRVSRDLSIHRPGYQSFDDMPKFAHISGPSVIPQDGHSFTFDFVLPWAFDLSLGCTHEMMNQSWYIACSMSQRWSINCQYCNSIKEILAEATSIHFLRQIAIGCRYDPHIN